MFREARHGDICRIVEMLADDDIARARENLTGDLAPYYAAFVWDDNGVVGCLQLTFIPGLSYQGAWTAQVEGVRVDASRRGAKIGEKMMAEVIARSRARGCQQLQLKTDKRRKAAQRFYQRLGFIMSHEGMKLKL
jgi:ribosomal protein S18 acetylase RimI-like enzyme